MERETGKDRDAPGENRDSCTTLAAVAAAYAEVLELDDPGHDCHFFLAGGDSLLSARLLAIINRLFPQLARALTLADLLHHPRVGDLALLVNQGLQEQTPPNAL